MVRMLCRIRRERKKAERLAEQQKLAAVATA